MKAQSILASVISIYNLEIRNGSKSKVMKEDSIRIYTCNGIQEGEANVLFVVYFFLSSKCIFIQESNLQC